MPGVSAAPSWPAMATHEAYAYLLLAATCVKVLLFPSYTSTDFEVHRGWMGLTSQLPISRWYEDDSAAFPSQWTLDYPPLFAYFERLLACGAPLFDPHMLRLSAAPYKSPATNTYMRLTVIATDTLLLLGAHALLEASHRLLGRHRPTALMEKMATTHRKLEAAMRLQVSRVAV